MWLWPKGANDVAHAIGPLAVIKNIVQTGQVGTKVLIPVFAAAV